VGFVLLELNKKCRLQQNKTRFYFAAIKQNINFAAN
jgi:hypothetical protein